MAFPIYRFSLPMPYVFLLELFGLLKFLVLTAFRRCTRRVQEAEPPVLLGDDDDENQARFPPPTPRSIKRRFPAVDFVTFLERKNRGRGEGDDRLEPHVCSICMCGLGRSDEVRELLCVHAFHRGCLDDWVDWGYLTCPVCRSKLWQPTGVQQERERAKVGM